ncbi:ABC-type thiamine transport system, periplasmic component [Candidatus Scalindua japonica]|uniref:ABC-type thiamine transport system, periplasmic component n=1 Tax=Candidatus Scalindua japonica TaxID=1284222 RepID=A0A286U2D5_9BACT|nr:hypothetical protein [Candidatus Scalindua japonica]GAX62300.1 ABC-type thiamine transport system, periplasmic component [Candidatus Scalindua japonica]
MLNNNGHKSKLEIKKYDISKPLTEQQQDEVYQLYKLRYSVYIKDLKYEQPHADHKLKILKDPLDNTGHLYGVFKNNEAIGTLLTNYTKHSDLGYYPELYKMHEFANSSYFDSSISTKFIVRKDFRSSNIAFKLACATLTQQSEDNIMYSFIDCIPENVPFFVRLGFKVSQKNMSHPEFGHGVALVIELQNIEELEKQNSLYLKHYRRTVDMWNRARIAA